MAEQAYAYVTLIPVAKGFQRAVSNELSGLGGEGANVGRRFQAGFAGALRGLAAPVAAALGGVAIGGFVKSAVSQASNLGESINAVNVSFGAAAEGIKQLGTEAATQLGLSTQQFNQLSVGFTAFAEKIAGPGGDVVSVIDDLTTRGADFASVMNLEVQDALTIFRSGLAGETEPLRRFGIDVSEASVKAFAYANGIADVGAELTEQEKIQARYGAIMEQTTRFAGDFANTSDGLANSQRILKATFADVQAEVGGALLPVLAELTTSMVPIVEDLTPILVQLFESLAPVIQTVVDNLGPLLTALEPLFEAFSLVAGVISEVLAQLLPPLIEIIGILAPVVLDLVTAFMPLIEQVLPALVSLIEALVPVIDGLAGFISDYVIPIVTALSEIFGEGLAFTLGLAEKAVRDLTTWLGPLFTALKPILDGLLQIVGIKPGDLKKTIEINYKVDPGTTGENNRFNNIAKELGLIPITPATVSPKLPKPPAPPKNTEAADAAKKAREAAIKERAALKKVIEQTREDFFEARAKYQEDIADIEERFAERRESIAKSYEKSVASANKRFAEQVSQITKRYNEAVSAATERRDTALGEALKAHNQKISDIQADFAKRQADLITQSMNRLRDAYRSAVQVNVASIFDSDALAGSIEGTVETLREKLLASRRLLANAAALTAAGFSQTFVEQVVGAGTDVGNELAESILGATPETKAELKALYNTLETESESGMDQLAKQITDQAGLATTELRNLYSANQVALVQALEAENAAYAETVAGINLEFNKAIADAQVARDEALVEAQNALDEALLEAKISRDEALAEAEEDFQDALTEAAEAYNKDLENIEKSFKEKVASMSGAAKGLANEIRGLNSAINQAQAELPPIFTGGSGGGGGSAMPWQFMAEGGFVTSATPAIIGEAGPEVVIPLDRFESMMNMGSGGPSVNYYAAPNQSLDSERDLFQAMKRAKVVVGW